MKSRVVRLIVSWLLVVCLALQLDCSGQSSLWSRAIDGSAVVMDEAWNSSRLAGGWSDLRTCVDVASARGSGVEMSIGWPTRLPPHRQDAFVRASLYDSFSVTETFRALLTCLYLLQPLKAAEWFPLQFTHTAWAKVSLMGQLSIGCPCPFPRLTQRTSPAVRSNVAESLALCASYGLRDIGYGF